MARFGLDYRLIITLSSGEQLVIQPPLTIDFTVDRQNFASSANNAQISIYNLGEGTRNKIFKDELDVSTYTRVELQIGYAGNLTTIYVGSILKAQSKAQGVDNITELESVDGLVDMTNVQTNRTFAKGTTSGEIITSLTGDFNNIKLDKVGSVGEVEFKRPYIVDGNTHESLQTVTNRNLFVDQEKLQVLRPNEVLAGQATVVDSNVGLLSVVKKDSLLIIESLLVPSATIGGVISLVSTRNSIYNGQYKVIGVNHAGTISEGVSSGVRTTINVFALGRKFGDLVEV